MRLLSTTLAVALLALAGCVSPAPPAPVSISSNSPPWTPPRDAIAHIRERALPELPLNDTTDPHVITMTLTVNEEPVTIPAHIGVDRVRAIQAPVHTHDDSGQVWLEGQGNRRITLGDFFFLWGVRFDANCLGAVCGQVEVSVDGQPVASPTALVLRDVKQRLTISASG